MIVNKVAVRYGWGGGGGRSECFSILPGFFNSPVFYVE